MLRGRSRRQQLQKLKLQCVRTKDTVGAPAEHNVWTVVAGPPEWTRGLDPVTHPDAGGGGLEDALDGEAGGEHHIHLVEHRRVHLDEAPVGARRALWRPQRHLKLQPQPTAPSELERSTLLIGHPPLN